MDAPRVGAGALAEALPSLNRYPFRGEAPGTSWRCRGGAPLGRRVRPRSRARSDLVCGSKKKKQNGFCSDLLLPPQPCAQPAPNQIRHALVWRNARPGTVRAATRARGSSLRNCTFWKEPSNHEFRVFVDEYLISNFMMSFLPPIETPPFLVLAY